MENKPFPDNKATATRYILKSLVRVQRCIGLAITGCKRARLVERQHLSGLPYQEDAFVILPLSSSGMKHGSFVNRQRGNPTILNMRTLLPNKVTNIDHHCPDKNNLHIRKVLAH